MKNKEGKYINPIRDRTIKKRRIKSADFVHMWEVSKDLDEFVRYSGMNRATAITRASLYRKKGVNLKKFSGKNNNNKLNIDFLNSMTRGQTNGK